MTRKKKILATRILGTIVIVSTAVAFALYAALHVLRPDYNPARRFLSEYAVGPFGALMTLEFFVQALIALSLALGLFLEVRRSRSLMVGCLLLAVSAVTAVMLGLFPGDLSDPSGGAPRLVTHSGAIHQFAGTLSFVFRAVAFLLLPRAYREDGQWQAFAGTAHGVGMAFLLLFLAFLAAVRWDLGGLAQRAAVAVGLVWFFLNGLQLRQGLDQPLHPAAP